MKPLTSIGIIVGFLFVNPSAQSQIQLVNNGSFETGSAVVFYNGPTTFGTWGGDETVYVGPTLGITPLDGSRMVQFLYTSITTAGPTVSCEYFQNIDVSAFSALIGSGNARINATGWFNRVAGNAQTDTAFNMRVRAKTGAVGGGTPFISEVGAGVLTDSNPATWERVDITGFAIPTGTNHLELLIYANENVFNNTTFPEFDGHFADNVSLSIYAVPEPGSLTLCALAASLGTVARLRRWQNARVLGQSVLISGPSDDRRRRRT